MCHSTTHRQLQCASAPCQRVGAPSTAFSTLQDFTNAVMDVDFSPTGREFVAAGYDRSVRIYPYNSGHSREVYTAKRMQRVFTARFTGDASYIVTGSDDFNMRVWKVCTLRRDSAARVVDMQGACVGPACCATCSIHLGCSRMMHGSCCLGDSQCEL